MLAFRRLQLWTLLLALATLCLCQAHPQGDYSDVKEDVDNESDAWHAGVFTPQPLKPAPWTFTQVPPAAARLKLVKIAGYPPPVQPAGIQVPGVGMVRGLRGYKNIHNRPIDAFLGIRYGQVSSGLGRFQRAQPAPYQGQVDARQASVNCAQIPELQRLVAAEEHGENVDDCLTLNIYAPAGARNLPVLVVVHGEMLFDGSAEEAQPDYLLEHDIVLVAINYRLAPFGFLSALSDELPGNAALSDLHLALEWVQRNIRYFGGDSAQVTLLGQAGGATLVHALSLSGQAKQLFGKLILQSGTALNPYFIEQQPLARFADFARAAGCPASEYNPAASYGCLSRLRTSKLVRAFHQLSKKHHSSDLELLSGFKLVVGDRLGYLPQHPAALVANNTVPTLIGVAKDAGAFILQDFYDDIKSVQTRNISDFINVLLRHIAPPQHHQAWHRLALQEIFTLEQTRFPTAQNLAQGLLELANLVLYRAPVIDSIRSTYRKFPTYLYTFDYRGEHHRFSHLENKLPFGIDATLSDDSTYLFPYPEEVSHLNAADKVVSRALVDMWINFIQSGTPNPQIGVWPAATSEYGPFLRFTNSKDNTLELDQHFGEGIYVPNLYSTAATTTTTTTPRPAYNYPNYGQRQPIYRPVPRRPMDSQPNAAESQLVQQQREQQMRQNEQRRREQIERELRVRLLAEQQQREQREREQKQREQNEREQKQREQEMKRQQELWERQQREQQAREQQAREQQEREQREREQQERERELWEQQQRNEQPQGQPEGKQPNWEQQEREQQEREQQEREQQAREQELWEQQQRNEQPQRQPEREEQDWEQQEREQQEREQQAREQELWEQQQRNEQAQRQPEREEQDWEQQEREQQEREQQEREQQAHEQELWEQQQRNEQPQGQDDRAQQARDPQERDQLMREQQEREQQERDEQPQEQDERQQQESVRQVIERLYREDRERQEEENQLWRQQHPQQPQEEEEVEDDESEQPEHDQEGSVQPEREQEDREQQERDQEEREQQEQEQQMWEQQERERLAAYERLLRERKEA